MRVECGGATHAQLGCLQDNALVKGAEELAGTVLLVAPRVVWGTTGVVALSAPVAMAGICCGYTP